MNDCRDGSLSVCVMGLQQVGTLTCLLGHAINAVQKPHGIAVPVPDPIIRSGCQRDDESV